MQEIWRKWDQDMQDKFHGKFGLIAFREIVSLAFMGVAHKLLKIKLDPTHHGALDRAWYGSLLPNHPMHGLRSAVQDKVANLAIDADDYFGGHIQEKFTWIDRQVPVLERHIDGLLAPAGQPRR